MTEGRISQGIFRGGGKISQEASRSPADVSVRMMIVAQDENGQQICRHLHARAMDISRQPMLTNTAQGECAAQLRMSRIRIQENKRV